MRICCLLVSHSRKDVMTHHQFQISSMRSQCDMYIIGRVHDCCIVNQSTYIIIMLLYFCACYCPLNEDMHSILYIANPMPMDHY